MRNFNLSRQRTASKPVIASSLHFRFKLRCGRIFGSQGKVPSSTGIVASSRRSVVRRLSGNDQIWRISMTVSSAARAWRGTMASVCALIAIILISNSAFGQNSSDSTPKWDFFGGYQYLAPGGTVPTVPGDPNNPVPFKLPGMGKGIGGAGAYNLDPHRAIESDFGYNRDTNAAASEWTAGAGPRYMWRTDNFNLFIHAVGTFNRLSYDAGAATHNGIGVVLGGGMDLPFSKMFSWRLFQVDYVWAQHNFANFAAPEFSSLRRPALEGVRLRTGVVINWGGAEPVPPAAACSIQPTEGFVGEPLTPPVPPRNFNPKHTVTYGWSGTGGQVTGKDTTASIDTTNAAPGSYAVTAKVTDPKGKKNNEASCSANYTVKALPPKNPPTISLSANPTDLVTGGSVNVTANCTSPDGVPVSVANWTSSAGTVSGSGTSATLSPTGVPAGPFPVVRP